MDKLISNKKLNFHSETKKTTFDRKISVPEFQKKIKKKKTI